MKLRLIAFAALALLAPTISQANELSTTANSCRAKSIERFYCPASSGWWYGPYSDNGCSVTCNVDAKAVCEEASCDDGEAVASSCSCSL